MGKLQDYVIVNIAYPIAAQEARRTPGVDRDDLEQELCLWVLEHPQQLARWFGDGRTFQADGRVAVALRNEARDYARRLARQSGMPFDEEDE